MRTIVLIVSIFLIDMIHQQHGTRQNDNPNPHQLTESILMWSTAAVGLMVRMIYPMCVDRSKQEKTLNPISRSNHFYTTIEYTQLHTCTHRWPVTAVCVCVLPTRTHFASSNHGLTSNVLCSVCSVRVSMCNNIEYTIRLPMKRDQHAMLYMCSNHIRKRRFRAFEWLFVLFVLLLRMCAVQYWVGVCVRECWPL